MPQKNEVGKSKRAWRQNYGKSENILFTYEKVCAVEQMGDKQSHRGLIKRRGNSQNLRGTKSYRAATVMVWMAVYSVVTQRRKIPKIDPGRLHEALIWTLRRFLQRKNTVVVNLPVLRYMKKWPLCFSIWSSLKGKLGRLKEQNIDALYPKYHRRTFRRA